MASVLFTIGGAVMNALAFSGTNFLFGKLKGNDEKECKKHDLALEKVQRTREKWNKHRMKCLDFINKGLSEKNEARAYIKNADKVMFKY